MNVGFVGLGKLGLPCALAIESRGHRVFGYDPSSVAARALERREMPSVEEGADALLAQSSELRVVDLPTVVRECETIFVAVQTPHDPQYEGATPIPETRSDFRYGYLCVALAQLADAIRAHGAPRNVVVISTVLPGTVARYVQPIVALSDGLVRLCYNPFFIAMGTVVRDFLEPEFVLLGADDVGAADAVTALYATLHQRPVFRTSIENAELTKVLYNTFIGFKIAFANTIMEVCHKTPGTDCDQVVDALSLATDRLISPRYLRGGMGDGGGCHPRDNIALSWLAQKLRLSHDLFEDVMRAREDQTAWLADLLQEEARGSLLPIVLLGAAFKPNTGLTTGSPALLLSFILSQRGVSHHVHDPHAPHVSRLTGLHLETLSGLHLETWLGTDQPAIYFISTRHDCWRGYVFPKGSIVLDPHRYIPPENVVGSRYVPIGRGA